ncbi:unnamed protein product [Penicillium pancosmium]
MLIDRCNFQEFWKAMEQSDMVGLFDKYGLGHAIAKLRNFKPLMNIVGRWHQSTTDRKSDASCRFRLWIRQLTNTAGANGS